MNRQEAHLRVIEAKKALNIAIIDAIEVAIEEMTQRRKDYFLEADLPTLPDGYQLFAFQYIETRGFYVYRNKFDLGYYYEFSIEPPQKSPGFSGFLRDLLSTRKPVDLRKGL